MDASNLELIISQGINKFDSETHQLWLTVDVEIALGVSKTFGGFPEVVDAHEPMLSLINLDGEVTYVEAHSIRSARCIGTYRPRLRK